ncbi:glycosyltransferase [Gilliamella sp. B14384H2]|uniref:glycosyltransferase n=1 Tax=unclassified Gilliamella TaxID=2685620 RepID=UPI0018DDA275|nr:glycosyltransferase [Gilliamella sp. B14384G10]MBI0039341.1 glycosyltransferase [Gilliamella sp. B14384G7]MBI0051000.1 glycosyltransferase [Gilliamella sp. B14384G13]MBI0053292.1 glycosyltransferase [Gilliamella sp. B14384H2]
MKPKLTIVVPVYNTEKYLRKCLDSLVNQTFKDIEILCINDGSGDNSHIILNEYAKKDSRIKIFNKANGGLSSARNVGIEHASGYYITFLDSDDYVESNAYELALSRFINDTVDLVHFSTNLVMEENDCERYNHDYFQHKFSGLVKLTSYVINFMDVCAWNKIYKLSIIKDYSIRFPEGKLYEDNPFFWSYALVSDYVYFVPERLHNYLSRKNSIMNLTLQVQKNKENKLSHELDRLFCFEELLTFIFKWNLLFKVVLTLEKNFEKVFRDELEHTSKKNIKKVLEKATDIVNKFSLTTLFPSNRFFRALEKRKYYKIDEINFITRKQSLFGFYRSSGRITFCLLGIKFKKRTFKSKFKKLAVDTTNKFNYLYDELTKLQKIITSNISKQKKEKFSSNRKNLTLYNQINLNDFKYYFENLSIIANLTPHLDESNSLFSFEHQNVFEIMKLAEEEQKPFYYIFTGFISNVMPPYGGAMPKFCSCISFIIDSKGYFNDGNVTTDLETLLNTEQVNNKELLRTKNVINKIISNKISKYNNYNRDYLLYKEKDKKNVLVVQSDWEIYKKHYDINYNFDDMLNEAICNNPNSNIVIKFSHNCNESQRKRYKSILRSLSDNLSVKFVEDNINPFDLINQIDEVYVHNDLIGFEALMCGKPVNVYGVPFYAGWGLTFDKIPLPRRKRQLSLEELFYIAYINYCIYVNPETKMICDIEEALEHLLKIKNIYK